MDVKEEITDIIRNPLLSAKCYKDNYCPDNPLSLRSVALKTIFLVLVSLSSAIWSWDKIMTAANEGTLSGSLSAWIIFIAPLLTLATTYFLARLKSSNVLLSVIHALAVGVFYGAISGNFDRLAGGIIFQSTSTLALVVLSCAGIVAWKNELINDNFLNAIKVIISLIAFIYCFNSMMLFINLHWNSILNTHHPIFFVTLFLSTVLAVMILTLEFSIVKEYQERSVGKDVEWLFASGLLFTTVWIYFGLIFMIAWLRGRAK